MHFFGRGWRGDACVRLGEEVTLWGLRRSSAPWRHGFVYCVVDPEGGGAGLSRTRVLGGNHPALRWVGEAVLCYAWYELVLQSDQLVGWWCRGPLGTGFLTMDACDQGAVQAVQFDTLHHGGNCF
jgi:hypothetical protein